MVTDQALIMKKTNKSGLDLFVQSISTGKPVSSSNVKVISLNGDVLAAASTDRNGHVFIPEISENGNGPVAITAVTGNDFAFVPYRLNGRSVDYSNFDVGGLYGVQDPDKLTAYIFNDRGEVLTDFYETNSYGLNVSFDADRKYGVLRKDGDCYLVDAELNYTKITSDCAYFGINFEGTHLFYCNADKVCIYDIENKKEILIDNSGFNACISPNGKVVSYIKYRS
ncbi:MAG: hypothetical protein J6P07_01845, partial [Spirochaetaceae bacterium]|nr:hypothetical protein [Spirochaetaceae bacterium]